MLRSGMLWLELMRPRFSFTLLSGSRSRLRIKPTRRNLFSEVPGEEARKPCSDRVGDFWLRNLKLKRSTRSGVKWAPADVKNDCTKEFVCQVGGILQFAKSCFAGN